MRREPAQLDGVSTASPLDAFGTGVWREGFQLGEPMIGSRFPAKTAPVKKTDTRRMIAAAAQNRAGATRCSMGRPPGVRR
jgi:hypothetical protein